MLTSPLFITLGLLGVATAADDAIVTIWIPDFHSWYLPEFVDKLQGSIINADEDATTVALQCPYTTEPTVQDRAYCTIFNEMTVTYGPSTVELSSTWDFNVDTTTGRSGETTMCQVDAQEAECTTVWTQSWRGFRSSGAKSDYYEDTAENGLVTITITAGNTPTIAATAVTTPAVTTSQVGAGASMTPGATTTEIASTSFYEHSTPTTYSTKARNATTPGSSVPPVVTENAAPHLANGLAGLIGLVAAVGGAIMLI
ncbi:hypothetical protein B0T10DRAFT_553021 [Thelonectria olida]|uniref:Uncharacterized protein n=1 Tax=Thelonectria olida TaxID=1576542 RepID=A0A9P8VSV6_9HYPO|nr:hypothetical protein B0T10DRAFT_553021 [Thelonectria olida]